MDEYFTDFTLNVSGPPPEEIRRRGTMLRRRKTLMGTGAGLAALAVLALPASAMIGGEREQVPVVTSPAVQAGGLEISNLTLPPVGDYRGDWVEDRSTSEVWPCGPAFSPMGETTSRSVSYTSSFKRGEEQVGGTFKAIQLDFASDLDAQNAVVEFSAVLAECSIPNRETFELERGEVPGGEYRGLNYSAPEACEGSCDAGWYHYLGFTREGSSVVVASYAVQAGPLPPSSPMGEEFEESLTSVR